MLMALVRENGKWWSTMLSRAITDVSTTSPPTLIPPSELRMGSEPDGYHDIHLTMLFLQSRLIAHGSGIRSRCIALDMF